MLQSSIAIMKNNASLIYGLCLIVGDFLALVAAFVGAYILRVTLDARPLIEAIPARTYLTVFLTLLPFWIIIFALLGLYSNNINEKRFSELGRLFIGSFIGLLFVIGYNFVSNKPIFPARLVPAYGFMLAFLFLVVFRNLLRVIRITLYGYGFGIYNVLIIGNTPVTEELVTSLIDSRHSGYRIVGLVGANQRLHNRHPNIPIFKEFAQALHKIGPDNVQNIVQTELYADPADNSTILAYAQEHHIAYRFIPGNTELFVGNIEVELFRSVPVIAVHQTPLVGWGRLAKRLFDLLVSTLLIIITSPIMIVLALLVKLADGGEVFFRQQRLTRFNYKFNVFKFRTMRRGYSGLTPEQAFAKMGQPDLIKRYRSNGDFLNDDPRLTRLGRWLRRTSLDELPQLFNVFRGELSLVGPRALIPAELEVYAKRHAILSVKSGLTGLAQVSGRRNISFDERRRLDMYYAQNWTFWLDLVILLKTIRVVLSGEGAK